MKEIHIIIAHSSYIIRKGLVEALRSIKGAVFTHEASDYSELKRLLNKYSRAIVIVAERIVSENRQNVKDLFCKKSKARQILFLCEKQTQAPESECNDGISLYETKETIIKTIENNLQDYIQSVSNKKTSEELTEREKTIVKNVAYGLSNKEIADKLFISIHTVTTHRKNITKKLGIKSVSGLTVYAILNKLISIDETKLI
mgnify:CR=1 FL=1